MMENDNANIQKAGSHEGRRPEEKRSRLDVNRTASKEAIRFARACHGSSFRCLINIPTRSSRLTMKHHRGRSIRGEGQIQYLHRRGGGW